MNKYPPARRVDIYSFQDHARVEKLSKGVLKCILYGKLYGRIVISLKTEIEHPLSYK